MSANDNPNFKMEYMLWMTDRDLAYLMGHVGDRALHEALQRCDPLVRHRVLKQISSIRKDHILHGGPWNNEVTEETIKAAHKYIERVVESLCESGEIGEFLQRYIA